MTHTRYAFIKANWHADIVDRALDGFRELIPADAIDVFDVPGAFEMPLLARDLAASGRYAAVAAAAFVVDGGIYRHDFVAQAVVDGLMRAGMDTGVPVLSVSLTPHHYQETEHHTRIYREHETYWSAYALCEQLVDIEQSFQMWRFRHMKTVERIIGYRRGTGGSSGVGFLKQALELSFFPELIEVRTVLGPGG